MLTEWTKNLSTPTDKEYFQNRILGAKDVLDRLIVLINEKEQTLDRSEMSIEVYNTPCWENRQAHKNGNREAFHWLRKLINLDQQRDINDRKLI
jgi:hypothetical protein